MVMIRPRLRKLGKTEKLLKKITGPSIVLRPPSVQTTRWLLFLRIRVTYLYTSPA